MFPRESFGSFPAAERADRLREQAACGTPDAGLREQGRPTARRAVLRLEF